MMGEGMGEWMGEWMSEGMSEEREKIARRMISIWRFDEEVKRIVSEACKDMFHGRFRHEIIFDDIAPIHIKKLKEKGDYNTRSVFAGCTVNKDRAP